MIIDIQKAIKFYELRDEIEAALAWNCACEYGWNGKIDNTVIELCNKIEAIEKEE